MKEIATVGQLVDALPRATPAVTPMRMLEIAVERGADIAMLEKLMALQERWEANEARKAFVAAVAAFKADPPTVVKNKAASFGSGKASYDYATLDQVCARIAPALSHHGLSHRWETAQSDGKVRVTCHLTHCLGHTESVTLESGADTSGSKNPIQAIGSAVTYLQRYTLLAVCGLAAGGQDDDGHGIGVPLRTSAGNGHAAETGELISAAQKDELVALSIETNANTTKLLAHLKVPSLDDLLASRFEEAKSVLVERKKAIEALRASKAAEAK